MNRAHQRHDEDGVAQDCVPSVRFAGGYVALEGVQQPNDASALQSGLVDTQVRDARRQVWKTKVHLYAVPPVLCFSL